MKKTHLLGATLLLAACTQQSTPEVIDEKANQLEKKSIPIPTVVHENTADEENYEERRDQYFDLIHSSETPVDWRARNKQTFIEKAEKRALLKQSKIVEIFADGALEGEWSERGSNNIAGNLRVTAYQKNTEKVYAISDGGILWSSDLDGENWVTLNDDKQLGREILEVIELESGNTRILATEGFHIIYSDDEGETWTSADGFIAGGGAGINLIELNDANHTLVYLYNRTSPFGGSGRNKLSYSTDHGETFTFVTDLFSSNRELAFMDAIHDGSAAYLLDYNDAFYKFEDETLTPLTADISFASGSSDLMVRATNGGGALKLYAMLNRTTLYSSTNEGETWDYVADLPTTAWNVGFEVSIDDPNTLYYGEVNLYRSINGGLSWNLVSEWWEYYDDIDNKIHADIMQINPEKKTDGTEFTLLGSHGGVSISYDELETTPNIALTQLNTGQFYDVLTKPDNPDVIYGGTQDQGFQRTLLGGTPGPVNFEQVISGDYGEMQLTHNGETVWAQYPGGWFIVYANGETDGGYSADFDVSGTHMPSANWIVPTGSAPYPEDNFIYVGGGNLDGGSGSHLIKLAYDAGSITSSQFDFDFRDASGANISAIETTPLDASMLYVVTENGRFFRSENEGIDFEMTEGYIGPSGSWIYTADIYASRQTPGLVFVGGSGYAGTSVYMSTDSAKTFVPLNNGETPTTMTYEMAMDPTERFLFAATDAGPYVYDMETEEWFDMAGVSAPLQRYISVEYIELTQTVRFATWGRGIWDFKLSVTAGVDENESQRLSDQLQLYPNPVMQGSPITAETSESGSYLILDLQGKTVANGSLIQGKNQINLSLISAGTYFFVQRDAQHNVLAVKKFIFN